MASLQVAASKYGLTKPLVIDEFSSSCSGGMTSQQQFAFAYNNGYQVTFLKSFLNFHLFTLFRCLGCQIVAIQCWRMVFGHASRSEGRNVGPERLEWSRRISQLSRCLIEPISTILSTIHHDDFDGVWVVYFI